MGVLSGMRQVTQHNTEDRGVPEIRRRMQSGSFLDEHLVGDGARPVVLLWARLHPTHVRLSHRAAVAGVAAHLDWAGDRSDVCALPVEVLVAAVAVTNRTNGRWTI